MIKIGFKIFRSNIWNCMLCFISSILVTSILVLFEGIKRMVFSTMSEYDKLRSALGIASQTYIYIILFIGIILILYTISNYSRVRISDYGMFMVLGSEKKDIIKMLITEYSFIGAISFLIGFIVGMLFLFITKNIIVSEGIAIILNQNTLIDVFLMVLFYIVCIFAISILINIFNLQKNSLSSLLKYEKKKGKYPSLRISIVGGILGLSCIIVAIIFLSMQPMTYKKMKSGIILLLMGTYLCFTYFGGLALYLVKKREHWYNNHILKIKNMYYRFSESKNIMLIVFIINFFVFVFININIVEYGNTSSKYSWKYPFDYVHFTESDMVNKIKEPVDNVDGNTQIFPYISLLSDDGGSYIGIPLSSYKKITGSSEELKHDEIMAILQVEKEHTEVMFNSESVNLISNNNKLGKFSIKKEDKEILFIAQQSENIRILVINDNDFSIMESLKDKNQVIVTQNLKQKDREVEKQLSNISKESESTLYSKELLMKQDREEDILTFIFYICIGIFLIVSNMTILAIKIWTEVPLLSKKYNFMRKLGMEDKDIKKNIKYELSIYMNVPFKLSSLMGIVMILYIAHTNNAEIGATIQSIEILFLLIVLQGLYIMGIRIYGYHLIEKTIKIQK